MIQNEIEFDPEKWYTTSQVVKLAQQGYSPFKSLTTLYKIINSGKLEIVVIGDLAKKKYYIQGKELVKFAESQKVTINNQDVKQMQEGSTTT